MKMKIVADSSANLLSLPDIDFGLVPLHIIVGENDYIDDDKIDLTAMQENLSSYKGKTSTSSPSPHEWENAFGDADVVFCITITSSLSGTYNSAVIAKDIYEHNHTGRKVYVLDSLSTGPEIALFIEKIAELIKAGFAPDDIYKTLLEYKDKTHLYFSLASLNNFAKNGRISPVIAAGIGLLGVRVVGKASDEGTLLPLDKCRGEKRALKKLIDHLKECGYTDGKIIIAHNNNEAGALELKKLIENTFGIFNGTIQKTRALCSYYAEPGSLLIGFEASLCNHKPYKD